MEYRTGTETYYRQMLELQDKLRKSEEERLKLEEKFNEIMQQSRDAEYERLRIMRHKYHKFLEEDKARQERNENILRTIDRIESRAKQLAAKTDRFKAFRKQYFENYLKQIPKQKQQTFDSNTSTNRPQYQNDSVRRKLFADHPTTANENVETKLALLEKYLRDNFDNFPREFPSSTPTAKQNGLYDGKQTNVLYDNKNYLDDASDSKESEEIQVDRYSPSKINGHQKASELLGNRIEEELDRLRNKKENELNNNSLDVQEINPEQVINDYKKLVSKSEEKFGLRNGLPKKIETFDNINKTEETNKSQMDIYNIDQKEENNLDLPEEEENSEDTKPPTDISLNLSSPSQIKEQFDESKQNQIAILPQTNNEEYLENSSKSEEITSIEKQQVQPLDVQRKQSNIETKPILSSQFKDIVKTTNISSKEEKLEQHNVEYDSNLDALNYSEHENINTDQQYIEQPQSNEFGDSISNQQYSKEQKYLPETYSEEYQEVQQQEYSEQQYSAPQNEIQEQYDAVQPDYKQDYENATLQKDTTEVFNEQQYESSDQQYTSDNPEQQYENPEQQHKSPEQQYTNPEQQYMNPEQQHESPEQQYTNPEQQYMNPEQQHESTEQQYMNPKQQYMNPKQQYMNPEQQYMNPEQQYMNPEQQYMNPEQQYMNPEQQYESSEQYLNPEQQHEFPEQQYINPEQQEHPPENYDQQYQQETYPEAEGEYDPQNYPQEYETQQPENYPQQQYPEGYDPQQYTEEQQLEYDQQYPQGQYRENVYQSGEEYLQGEQNVDLQYETEQQQSYPEGYLEQENEVNEAVTESDEIAAVIEQKQLEEDNKPLVQKKLPNLADMLDTDTSESVKLDTKVSDNSDFDFSNTKT